jgi:acetyltransferase-like isoleucine patch superfamily enzyme
MQNDHYASWITDDPEADSRLNRDPHSPQPALVVYRPIRMEHTMNNAPHPAPEAEEVYRRWIQFLDEEFTRHHAPEQRAEIVRDQLTQLYLGRPHGGKLNLTLTSELPGNVLTLSLDPDNVTLEAEHFADADPEQFAQRKPLLWFWQMFDRSPIGTNHWLGVRFRAMLGRHLFARIGAGVKIFHGVELTFGYNLAIEEGAVIRHHAMLNDRGGITIGKGAVIGSFARIYSHSHAAHNYGEVMLQPTVIGPAARIASHAIVLAGQRIAAGELVGSFPAERK